MDMMPQAYQQYVQEKMKKSPIWKDVCLAFIIGGAIFCELAGKRASAKTGIAQAARA